MKKMILFCLASTAVQLYGQTFVNRGAPIAVTQGAVMIVRADTMTTGSGSLENDAQTTGIFSNKGQVTIEGSFVNTSGTADGYHAHTGQYIVYKNWENNATFHADSCKVVLNGDHNQLITGSNPTTFHDLICNGAGTAKTQTVNASVNAVLTLNGTEVATQDNDLSINNPDPAAIMLQSANTSFVSSTGSGRLIRNTNQKAEYIFPTGINENGPKIREVSITPANTQSRTYKVRFADNANTTNTTSTDGYDTTRKAGVAMVNDAYYHLIASSDNDPADLGIFYDPTADHQWQTIARWQSTPEWENLQDVVRVPGQSGTNRVKAVRSAWVPTADEAHALADSVAAKRDFNFPSAFVADGLGMPSENTYFGIINQADLVILDELSVFNRWGEMVFNSKRDASDKWNGHYHDKLQAQGNYVYMAVVRNRAIGKVYPTVTGNVSLLW
jgi:hypothetical protein